MHTFSIGKIYYTRSIVNADHIIELSVISRTAKTIKVLENGAVKTLRVSKSYEGHEMVKPWGSYSMAPMVTAEKVRA